MNGELVALFRQVLALLARANDELLAVLYAAIGEQLTAVLLEAKATEEEWDAFLVEHPELAA